MQPGVRFQRCLRQPLMRADYSIVEFLPVVCGVRNRDDAISRVARHEVLRYPRLRAEYEEGDTATSNTDGVEVRANRVLLNQV